MKRWVILGVVFTLALGVFGLPNASAVSTVTAPTVTLDCTGITATAGGSFVADRDNLGDNIEEIWVIGRDGNDNEIFSEGPVIRQVGTTFNLNPGFYPWQTPPQANPLRLYLYSPAGGNFDMPQWLLIAEGECPDEEPAEESVPGCDVGMVIPAWAVGGHFNWNAETYWAPGKKTNPVVTIEAGNTAWVLGLDASGEYYKIIWQCQYLWVEAGTMGPNFDEVWLGAPLPTEVVE